MTNAPRSRPFSLRDALSLVAALSLGFALTRSLSDVRAISRFDIVASGEQRSINVEHVRAGVNFAYSQASKAPSRWIPYAAYVIQRAVFGASPCIAALTLSVLIMAFISTRRPKYRLWRRPGILAAIAFVAAFCITAVESFPVPNEWLSN